MYNIARDTGGINSSIPGPEMMVTVFSNAIANILNTRCYATNLHLMLPDPDKWEIGTVASREQVVDCDHPVTFIQHEDGSLEIKVLVGSLQFEQSRSIVVNLQPISPDARIKYWVSYWQGAEIHTTAPESLADVMSIIPAPGADYELLRTYACLQLKRMSVTMRRVYNQDAYRYENLPPASAVGRNFITWTAVRQLEATWTDQVALVWSQAPEHADYGTAGGGFTLTSYSALANQCSTNFKDEALQGFVGELVAMTSDCVSEVFDELPNTEPPGMRYGGMRAHRNHSKPHTVRRIEPK